MFSKFDPRRSSPPFGGGPSLPSGGAGGGIGPAPGFAQGTMSPRIDRSDDPLELPIGQSAMVARLLAGVGALGIAWLMFASGSALTGFFSYLLMVFYVGAGLWTLATVRSEVIAKQFAIEIIILVFVSATARLLYPQVFASDYEEKRSAVAVENPNKYEGYLLRSEVLSDEIALFLEGKTDAGKKEEGETVRTASKKRMDEAWKAVQQRYKAAVRSSSAQERQKGFQMHESYRYAQDLYETIAPELRRIIAGQKDAQGVPIILPGPIVAKSKEMFPLWTASLERLEARGKGNPEAVPATGK